MAEFRLEMITPERTFFEGDVESLTVVDDLGEQQFLAHHAPVVLGLRPAVMRMVVKGKTKYCANGEGFLTVTGEGAVLMCQTLEWPEEIDESRVNKAIEEHSVYLDTTEGADYRFHKMTLDRAYARLKVLHLQRNR